MKKNLNLLFILSLIFISLITLKAQDTLGNKADTLDNKKKSLVFTFEIKEEIAKPAWRTTQEAFAEAKEKNADLVIIEMNTYGGQVDIADSIRTKILNSPIPVYVFIDDNAASAGALISIACDRIYIKPGGKIGAATVVNQTGEEVPDKYQSYMRATMRATAESHGKDTIINVLDTTYVWHRDPRIAEAMVDASIHIPAISDSGKVLTFTAEEAVKYGYSEGLAMNIRDVLAKAGVENYEIHTYSPTLVDKIINLFLSPIVQGLLVMVIIGGIYFELQTPGIGFPLAASVLAAILYFAPLYLEGMANNWELIVFIIGIVLIAVEIFAIPGFGVAGSLGIIFALGGLTMAAVDNVIFETGDITLIANTILRSFVVVLIATITGLVLSFWLGKQLFTSSMFPNLALNTIQDKNLGFIGVESMQSELVGMEGIAYTVLRPSGKVEINGEIYDAKAEYGFIQKDTRVKVIRYETGQIYVEGQ